MKKIHARPTAAIVACAGWLLAAQAAPPDGSEAAPQPTYRSAFADYKPYRDIAAADWRTVNEAVVPADRGDRAVAPAPVPASAPAEASKHGMQRMHGGRQ